MRSNYFSEGGAIISSGIRIFHDYLTMNLVFIVCFIVSIIFIGVLGFRTNIRRVINVNHGTVLEIVWTIIPGMILMVIGVPSFGLLYSLDNIGGSDISVKVVGNQWYWIYEVEDILEFDSYILGDDGLVEGEFRLLEVDNRLLLPVDSSIRMLVSSSDVLHSFAVPGLGVKMDGCPGRLNSTDIYIRRPGVYYGQCSELCGVNHAFMPICIEAVELGRGELGGVVEYVSNIILLISIIDLLDMMVLLYVYMDSDDEEDSDSSDDDEKDSDSSDDDEKDSDREDEVSEDGDDVRDDIGSVNLNMFAHGRGMFKYNKGSMEVSKVFYSNKPGDSDAKTHSVIINDISRELNIIDKEGNNLLRKLHRHGINTVDLNLIKMILCKISIEGNDFINWPLMNLGNKNNRMSLKRSNRMLIIFISVLINSLNDILGKEDVMKMEGFDKMKESMKRLEDSYGDMKHLSRNIRKYPISGLRKELEGINKSLPALYEYIMKWGDVPSLEKRDRKRRKK